MFDQAEQRIWLRIGRVRMVPGGFVRRWEMKALDFWVWMSWARAVVGVEEMKDLKRGFRDSKARGCGSLCKFHHVFYADVGWRLTIVANILSNSGHEI